MQLKLYKCLPYLLSITDQMDEHSNGQANGPVVRIRKGKEGDKGLLYHELEHVKQWYYWILLLGIPHSILYKLSKRYRQWSEVGAYKIQLVADHPSLEEFERRSDLYATWLSLPEPEGYDLDISKQEALTLLKN